MMFSCISSHLAARLLSELVQCRWVGVKALEQCPGAGRVMAFALALGELQGPQCMG